MNEFDFRQAISFWTPFKSSIFSLFSFSFKSNNLDFNILIAVSLFIVCERSDWHETTTPVGICVILTAESVLLICWPPAP